MCRNFLYVKEERIARWPPRTCHQGLFLFRRPLPSPFCSLVSFKANLCPPVISTIKTSVPVSNGKRHFLQKNLNYMPFSCLAVPRSNNVFTPGPDSVSPNCLKRFFPAVLFKLGSLNGYMCIGLVCLSVCLNLKFLSLSFQVTFFLILIPV